MNSRERILAAICHKQPDRVPIDLSSTPSSGISVVAYQNLIGHLGKTHLKTLVYDVIQETIQPEMELLDFFKVDVIDIARNFNVDSDYWHELEVIDGHRALYPHWFKPEQLANGSVVVRGETGEIIGRMPPGATFFDQVIFPYEKAYPVDYKNLSEDMKHSVWGGLGISPWDLSGDKEFWKVLREKTIELKSKTDKALVLGIGCNLFETGTMMRRMDNFLTDLFLEPSHVHEFVDVIMEMNMDKLAKTCEAVGDVVDIIKFGDDLGTTRGPFFAAETYNEFFKPGHKRMCEYVKSNSSMHTMLHCCGGIYELIPELIDAGFEILNPVQINARNMEPEKLKSEFGKDVTFWGGGVDTASILNRATPQQVKDHVKRNLEVFSTGGGFVFNTVHNIMPDVPPQNIVAMFEAVNEFNN